MSRSMARWWYIAPCLLFFWIFGQMDKLGISVIITNHTFLSDFGLLGNTQKTGYLLTAFTVVYSLSSLVWGVIIDRIGPRKAAIIGVTIWGLTMILGALSTSYGMFLLSRMILGVGEGAMFPVSNKLVANWFHPREYGRAQSIWIVGDYLGPAIGAPLIVAIMLAGGWRTSFWVLAGFSLVLSLPMFIFMARDNPDQHFAANASEREYVREGRGQDTAGEAPRRNVFSDYRFWVIFVAMLFASVLFWGLSFWMPTYLENARHFSPAMMSSWTSSAWILALIVVLCMGVLGDRTNRPATLGMVVFLVEAIAMFVTTRTANPSLAAFMLDVGIACVGAILEVCQLALVKYAVPRNTGAAAGLIGFTNIVGGFIGPFIGYLVKTSGSFNSSIIFLMAVALAGFVTFLCIVPSEARSRIKYAVSA
ncbi:MAG: MFS transporter [Alicyclobacillus sp.]|nr:MFS transporter [Alicyclobacillus sp.]